MEAELFIDITWEVDFISFKMTSRNKLTLLLDKMQCNCLRSITLHFATEVIVNIITVVTLY